MQSLRWQLFFFVLLLLRTWFRHEIYDKRRHYHEEDDSTTKEDDITTKKTTVPQNKTILPQRKRNYQKWRRHYYEKDNIMTKKDDIITKKTILWRKKTTLSRKRRAISRKRRHFLKTKKPLRIIIPCLYPVGQHRPDPVQRGAVHGPAGPACTRHHTMPAPARVWGLPRPRPRMENNLRGIILYIILLFYHANLTILTLYSERINP